MKFELNEERNGYTLVVGDDVPTVDIPREYDGKPVTRIGRFAFYCCTSLKSVYYNGDKASWNKIRFGNWSANPLCYGATLYTKLEKRR